MFLSSARILSMLLFTLKQKQFYKYTFKIFLKGATHFWSYTTFNFIQYLPNLEYSVMVKVHYFFQTRSESDACSLRARV